MKLVFDTETNGFKPSLSVLSFSAVLLDDSNSVISEFDRYYHCKEDENPHAIKVNGLTQSVVTDKRQGCSYPKHFFDDNEIKDLFAQVDTIIAHNVKFDVSFVVRHHGIDLINKKTICTMGATQLLYNAPSTNKRNGQPKFPKLSEAIDWAGIDIEKIKKRTGKGFHDSLFDVHCTYELYKHLVEIGEV